MKVSCPSCQSTLSIDDKKIPATGARIKCPTCQNIFPVKPAAGVPLPGAASPALPTVSAARGSKQDWEDQPTRAVPLPGGPAVQPPFPEGSSSSPSSVQRARQEWEDQPTRAVPLPGFTARTATTTTSTAADNEPTQSVPGARTASAPPSNLRAPGAPRAVPLPGSGAAPTSAPANLPSEIGAPTPEESFDLDFGGTTEHLRPPLESTPSASGVLAPSIPLPGSAPHLPPTPAPARPPSVPLPGSSESAATWAPTPGSIPLPGGTASAAPLTPSVPPPLVPRPASIPLPGGAAAPLTPSVPPPLVPRPASIPLPGGAAAPITPIVPPALVTRPASIPLPGVATHGASSTPIVPPAPATRPASIPLPGVATHAASSSPIVPPAPATRPASIPLPGATAAARAPTIPLPGASVDSPEPADFDPFSAEGALAGSAQTAAMPPLGGEFDLEPAPASTTGGFDLEQPPPGSAFDFAQEPTTAVERMALGQRAQKPAQAFAFDEAAPVPVGFEFDAPPGAPAFGFDQPAPATGGFEIDVPTSAPAFSLEQPAPAASGFDFDVPPPAMPALSFEPPAPDAGFDLGEAPAAPAFSFDQPAPAASGFDFAPAAPPAPGGFEFDVSAPPPPAGPSMGFGEVDLSGTGEPAQGPTDLEFDPSQEPSASDALEADLSAPLPSAQSSGTADGLEMLSFIDDSAKEAGVGANEQASVRRFHVKRRSGKVFGPFEDAVIAKMLEEGQLLGNEEVSLDAQSWQPVGSEPAFQAVIARLMEAPSRTTAAAAAAPAPTVEEHKGPSMERLKQLYEGRMAAVAVVQGKDPVPFKKRLPYLIGGLVVALVVITGITTGVGTPYGPFGLKVLFPSRVREGTREFEYLQSARKGFLSDTWHSYNAAKESAASALVIKEFPEARAVWCQAVFYLARKYRTVAPAELAAAQAQLVNVKLLGDKHPEVLRTLASEALTRNAPDEASGFIADALARDSSDLDSLFLRAEVYLQKKQPAQAKTEFEQILTKDPKSARALHGLGLLNRSKNEIDEASARFTQALAADPGHLASAVELAEITIMVKKDLKGGSAMVDPGGSGSVQGEPLGGRAEQGAGPQGRDAGGLGQPTGSRAALRDRAGCEPHQPLHPGTARGAPICSSTTRKRRCLCSKTPPRRHPRTSSMSRVTCRR
jgi:predicted Zn finger-like uncharacterized protein